MNEVKLTIKGTIESLHLEPGDKIIVTLTDPLHPTLKQIEGIKGAVHDAFPNHDCLIVAPGVTFGKVKG